MWSISGVNIKSEEEIVIVFNIGIWGFLVSEFKFLFLEDGVFVVSGFFIGNDCYFNFCI